MYEVKHVLVMTRSTIPWLRGRLHAHRLDALKQGVEFHTGRPNTFNNFDEYELIVRQCTEHEY